MNKYEMAKHFRRTSTDTSFSYERDAASIAEEVKLDGLSPSPLDLANYI